MIGITKVIIALPVRNGSPHSELRIPRGAVRILDVEWKP